MNNLFGFRRLFLMLLIGSLAMTACTTQDADDLPMGKYPLLFQTTVDGHVTTRVTYANAWQTTDEVAVSIGGTVKCYMPNTSNVLSAKTGVAPFTWSNSTETKQVRAWHPYNSGLSPTSWSVQSNQNGTSVYAQSEFLYAPPTDISFSNQTTELKFYHQTSKVDIKIYYNSDLPSASQIASVTIGNANNLALKGNYVAPTSSSQRVGTWSSNTTTMGTVTPWFLQIGASYCSYAALIVPQDMTGKKFIAVKLTDGKTYYYTPQGTEANLQGGKCYTYNITLKKGTLEVTTTATTGWADEGSTAVSDKEILAEYTATDLKPGDFFYKGFHDEWVTSDGGLRTIYTDGSIRRVDLAPDDNKGYLLGVVFRVDRPGSSSEEYDDCVYYDKTGTNFNSSVHGYVMGLRSTGIVTWASSRAGYTRILPYQSNNLSDASNFQFRGYMYSKLIKTYSVNQSYTLSADFPALYYASEWQETQNPYNPSPSPNNSTGWYLPSAGELRYIYGKRSVLMPFLTAANPSFDFYFPCWSSCEYYDSNSSDPNSKAIKYDGGSVGQSKMYYGNYVFPCLVF